MAGAGCGERAHCASPTTCDTRCTPRGPTTASDQWVAAFMQRLREHGWIDGRNIAIEFRWAGGQNERYTEIAAEFVRLNVDVIVTTGTAAVVAAKQTTSVVPIVFASAGDPVATGLVASLARPAGAPLGENEGQDRLPRRQGRNRAAKASRL